MHKTPGQVAYERTWRQIKTWDEETAELKVHWEDIASAVITHIRPQIEAKARAAVIEDVLSRLECSEASCVSDDDEIAIRALATAPPGHVLASADDLCAIMDSVRSEGHLKTNLQILADRAKG